MITFSVLRQENNNAKFASSGKASDRHQVRFSVATPSIPTNICLGFSGSLQAKAGILGLTEFLGWDD
jgi:hypothetical protein